MLKQNAMKMAAVGMGILSSLSLAHGDCPCKNGMNQATMAPIPLTSGPQMMPGPMMNVQPTNIFPPPAMVNPQFPPAYGNVPPSPGAVSPGDSGYQYYRATREIPASKPPRVGMVDVKVPAEITMVKVYDIHPFREEDLLDGFQDKNDKSIWRFESRPLIPGISHVYRVVIFDAKGMTQSKYFRLIPGRVVDISF
jgi:hypothetical protein